MKNWQNIVLKNRIIKLLYPSVSKGPVLYDLYAICNHAGTVNMGHYTACCLDENGWCFYNDCRWDPVYTHFCIIHRALPHACHSRLFKTSVYGSSIMSFFYTNLQLFLLFNLHLFTYSVTPVSENQLQTNQAYVLFYQRSNSTTPIRK